MTKIQDLVRTLRTQTRTASVNADMNESKRQSKIGEDRCSELGVSFDENTVARLAPNTGQNDYGIALTDNV